MPNTKNHEQLLRLLDAQQGGARLYATLVRLTLHHEIAADLLQELFVQLRDNEGFLTANDPERYAWRSAIHLAMRWRRLQRRENRRWTNLQPDRAVSQTPSVLESMIQTEELSQVLDVLSDLSELAQNCFVMRLIERRSYVEIAQDLGKTPHQVRGHCHAAVRQIRQRLSVDLERCAAQVLSRKGEGTHEHL